METMKEFIRKNKIRMLSEHADLNPNIADDDWSQNANHFKCILRRSGKQMTVPFSMGSALKGDPEPEDVLSSLAADAAGVEDAQDFEEWASGYGYDTDSRKAEKTYKVCQAQADKLKNFLGADLYKALLWEVESL